MRVLSSARREAIAALERELGSAELEAELGSAEMGEWGSEFVVVMVGFSGVGRGDSACRVGIAEVEVGIAELAESCRVSFIPFGVGIAELEAELGFAESDCAWTGVWVCAWVCVCAWVWAWDGWLGGCVAELEDT